MWQKETEVKDVPPQEPVAQEATGPHRSPNPLVSVLITNFNYERYIRTAIESVWSQSYRPLELVVVDDGSSDDSWAILQELKSVSPVPMETVQSDHGGAVSAFNTGLAYCHGEFISYLHADDVMTPHRVLQQIDLLEENPDAVLAHSEYICVDQDGQSLGFGSDCDVPAATGRSLKDLLRLRRDVRSVTMTFRSAAVEALDESLSGEDWQLILQLASKGGVRHSPEPLVLRRIHGANASLIAQGNRDPEFRFEDVALSALCDVMPDDISLSEIVPRHVATVLRNAMLQGNWRKAADAYSKTVSSYPGVATRWILLRAWGGGFSSRAWHQLLYRLPNSAADYLARQARRLRRSVA